MNAAQLAGALGGSAGLLVFVAFVIGLVGSECRNRSSQRRWYFTAILLFVVSASFGLAAIWLGASAS